MTDLQTSIKPYRTAAADRRYVCSACGTAQPLEAECAACGDAPLLDLADAAVRSSLAEQDVRGRLRYDRVLDGATSVSVLGAIVVGLIFAPRVLYILWATLPFGILFLASLVGGGLAIRFFLRVAIPFRARFPYLTREDGA